MPNKCGQPGLAIRVASLCYRPARYRGRYIQMGTKRLLISLCLLVLLCPSCDTKKPIALTPEQMVYESLFFEVVGSTYKNIYVAAATDSSWFSDNPIDEIRERALQNGAKLLSSELLTKLYQLNSSSEPIDWMPIMVAVTFLPQEFADSPNNSSTDSRCLVPRDSDGIGVYAKDGQRFRAYYTVSRVAFDERANTALVKLGYHCAPLSGAGEWLLAVSFVDNQWKVTESILLWIS